MALEGGLLLLLAQFRRPLLARCRATVYFWAVRAIITIVSSFPASYI